MVQSSRVLREANQLKKQIKKHLDFTDHHVSSYQNIKHFADLPSEFGHNQHIYVDQEFSDHLRNIVRQFQAPIRYGFAYGSGVFSQGTSSTNKPQVDMIFGVSHPQHWHSLNMKYNPQHYSGLRFLGSNVISKVQDNIGGGVYYNPFVEINGTKLKYGVVSIDTLKRDLQNWDTLYLAGRLHKPVKILRDEPQVRFVNQRNLISALRTALLLLPETFSEYDLYMKIAGISYMGDLRMVFGENPHKVHNIVQSQFLNFRRLYSPLMDALSNLELVDSDYQEFKDGISITKLSQDMDSTKRGNIVARLPATFRSKLYAICGHPVKSPAIDASKCDEGDIKIAADEEIAKKLSQAIHQTVRWSSFTQSAKGILTAGLLRSLWYTGEKLEKYKKSQKAN